MSLSQGPYFAKDFLKNNGFLEITDISMDLIVSGLGAILIEEPIKNADGIIHFGNPLSVIKVNSEIKYEARKRFTIAYEIGHLLMHKDIEPHFENTNTLNWFNATEKQLKKGIQELEANEFAAELLMPEKPFVHEVKNFPFSPDLLKHLADRFQTSITSTVFRYLNFPLQPICVFFISNGRVKYWKKSSDLKVFCKNVTKLSPPSDSVAQEYINANYEFIYSGKEKTQEISKSTWFELYQYETDTKFFEYCIPTKQYKTIISVVWEE
jgi:Zn-dependent peptidase ImmA (M78 family)